MNCRDEIIPALDPAEEYSEIIIQVHSFKYNCYVAQVLTEGSDANTVIRFLKNRLEDHIKEKINAISEGKES